VDQGLLREQLRFPGAALFISTSIAGNRIGNTIGELPPFYLVAIAVTLLVSYVPWFSLAFL